MSTRRVYIRILYRLREPILTFTVVVIGMGALLGGPWASSMAVIIGCRVFVYGTNLINVGLARFSNAYGQGRRWPRWMCVGVILFRRLLPCL